MRTSGRALGLVMAVLALATLAGCKTDTTTTASTSAGGASVAATPAATPAAGVTEAPPAAPSGTVTRPAASTPAAGRAGEPNRALTPGHAFASATTSQVCISGYSRSVRYVTTAVREQVFAAYRIGYPPPAGAYELDHLIPLELVGNSASNLWPEPYHGANSANVKDNLENHLHTLVCIGQVELGTAQQAMAGDWRAAAARYGSTAAASSPSSTTSTSPAPSRTEAPVSGGNREGHGAVQRWDVLLRRAPSGGVLAPRWRRRGLQVDPFAQSSGRRTCPFRV